MACRPRASSQFSLPRGPEAAGETNPVPPPYLITREALYEVQKGVRIGFRLGPDPGSGRVRTQTRDIARRGGSFMKKLVVGILVALLAVALLPLTQSLASHDDDFEARLSSYQEVPSLSTPARGKFDADVDRRDQTIDYKLRYEGFETEVLFAHIHLAQKGVNGGVIAFLCGGGDKPACPQGSGTVTGTIDVADIIGPAGQGIAAGEFDEAVKAIKAGVVYANVHSQTFQGGEIRGQLFEDD
jgi:hypothetical protein